MNKPWLIFLFLVVLVVAAFILGAYDPVSSVAPRAQAEMAVGDQAVNWINFAMKWSAGIAFGSFCTGLGVAAFKALYRKWKISQRQKQPTSWQSGPNAQWQTNQVPRLTKSDLMFYSLLNGQRLPPNFRTPRVEPQDDDVLEIEI
ncbi:MAG: hypothetical protein EHM40_03325 [Chloroflexi bacterium]|nr:MAG: hypothetical protein EHM40_03325 [Chloroflexota bacterium]